MFRFAYLVLLVVVGESMAQMSIKGSCPTVASAENYTFAEIANKPWYHQNGTYYLLSAGGRCGETTYYSNADGTKTSTVKVISNKNNQTVEYHGNYSVTSSSNEAEMELTINELRLGESFQERHMATDGMSYLLVWSCKELENDLSAITMWAMTADRSPTVEVMQQIADEYEANNIDTTPMLAMDQSNCS